MYSVVMHSHALVITVLLPRGSKTVITNACECSKI